MKKIQLIPLNIDNLHMELSKRDNKAWHLLVTSIELPMPEYITKSELDFLFKKHPDKAGCYGYIETLYEIETEIDASFCLLKKQIAEFPNMNIYTFTL